MDELTEDLEWLNCEHEALRDRFRAGGVHEYMGKPYSRRALEHENAKLREALMFYADNSPHSDTAKEDNGEKARAALGGGLAMTDTEAITLILDEVKRARGIHPGWPSDPIHAAAVLAEEAGETVQASLDLVYHNGSRNAIVAEAVQTGAMAVRLLVGR